MTPYCQCPECRELDSVPDGLWNTTQPRPHTEAARELIAAWRGVRDRLAAEQRTLAEATR